MYRQTRASSISSCHGRLSPCTVNSERSLPFCGDKWPNATKSWPWAMHCMQLKIESFPPLNARAMSMICTWECGSATRLPYQSQYFHCLVQWSWRPSLKKQGQNARMSGGEGAKRDQLSHVCRFLAKGVQLVKNRWLSLTPAWRGNKCELRLAFISCMKAMHRASFSRSQAFGQGNSKASGARQSPRHERLVSHELRVNSSSCSLV